MLKPSYSKSASQSTSSNSQPFAKEIRAEKFVLVDSDGNDRARLHVTPCGHTVLALLDQNGDLRLTLRASQDECAVTVFQLVKGLEDCQPLDRVIVGYSPDYEPGLHTLEYAGAFGKGGQR